MAPAVHVGLGEGAGGAEGAGVPVGVAVAVAVGTCVQFGVAVPVAVTVLVGVVVGVAVGVGVSVGVAVGVGVEDPITVLRVALLFRGGGVPTPATVAVLSSVPEAPGATSTSRSRVGKLPLAGTESARVQVTVCPAIAQTQPTPPAARGVSPAGRVLHHRHRPHRGLAPHLAHGELVAPRAPGHEGPGLQLLDGQVRRVNRGLDVQPGLLLRGGGGDEGQVPREDEAFGVGGAAL